MKSKILLFTAVVLCATACGISSWTTTTQNQNQTNVVLSENNFRIVKTVSAEVHSKYVFGIGGLTTKSLMANAISELTKKADLKGSQALINITTHTHRKFILLHETRSMVAQGIVIEFLDKNGSGNYSDKATSSAIQDDFSKGITIKQDFQEMIKGKSVFEVKQIARKYCRSILEEIEYNNIKSAREKFETFVQQWEKCSIKDSETDTYIKSIKQSL